MNDITNYLPNERCNILSLLPYSEHAELGSKLQKLGVLYLLNSILDLSITGLECFEKGQLLQFDAQVGENLCQIRAYKILYFWRKRFQNACVEKKILRAIDNLKKYKAKLKSNIYSWENAIKLIATFDKTLDSTECIIDFLQKNQLFFKLENDFVFIITCFFLTRFNIRKENIPIAIDLKLISNELNISKYRAKRLMHKYQQIVSKLGCDFVIMIAKELSFKNYSHVLPKLYQVSDEDRAVLPCYLVSEIIFYHCIQEKFPVFFIIKRLTNRGESGEIINLLLIGKNKMEFSLESCKSYLSHHCIVVSGEMHYDAINSGESVEKYVNRVLEENPLKLILANMAMHPQYAGKKLEALRDNPFSLIHSDANSANEDNFKKDFMDMKQFAIKVGCSMQNPRTFLLRHIYTSKVSDEIQRLASTA